jgi:hypothetical protein
MANGRINRFDDLCGQHRGSISQEHPNTAIDSSKVGQLGYSAAEGVRRSTDCLGSGIAIKPRSM